MPLLFAASVHAQTTLTGGRTLSMKVKAGGKSTGTINVVKDPELYALVNPALSGDVDAFGSIVQSAVKARDRAAVRQPGRSRRRRLRLQGQASGPRAACSASPTKAESSASSSRGAAFSPLTGPVTFAEVRLRIGATTSPAAGSRPSSRTTGPASAARVRPSPANRSAATASSTRPRRCDDGNLQRRRRLRQQLHADRVRQRHRNRQRSVRRRQRGARRRLPSRLHDRGVRRRGITARTSSATTATRAAATVARHRTTRGRRPVPDAATSARRATSCVGATCKSAHTVKPWIRRVRLRRHRAGRQHRPTTEFVRDLRAPRAPISAATRCATVEGCAGLHSPVFPGVATGAPTCS